MKLLKILYVVLFAVSPLLSSAQMSLERRYELRNEILDSLKYADSYSDSLKMLYNAYDLSTRSVNGRVGRMILEAARNAGDNATVNDIIMQLSSRYSSNDSIQAALLEDASKLPYSEMKRQTVAFLCMMRNSILARKSSENDRQRYLQSTISKLTNDPPVEIYDKIVVTHSVCAYLAQSFRGELMNKYFSELISLVEQLPQECYALRNFIYVQACLLYAKTENYDKSIFYHKKLLAQIDSLESRYHATGRPYRDYNASRYIRYMTLLQCYKVLSRAQIDECYQKALYHASRDSDAMIQFQKYETPTLYYMMATQQYKDVIPVIKRQINLEYNASRRREYLKFLIEASMTVNDNQTLLEASIEYNSILEEFIKNRDFEKYKELQVIYDVYELKSDKYRLELENQTAELGAQKKAILFGVISMVVLAVFMFVFYRLYINAHRLSNNLSHSNEMLKVEKENLQKIQKELIQARDEAVKASKMKSDFIANISSDIKVPLHAITEYSKLIVDCAEGEKKTYLEKFAGLIDFNSELLTTIVNDMLHLSELENSTITLSYSGVKVSQVCNLAVDTVMSRVAPGVQMFFEPGENKDITVSSDRRRIEQVLVNLLSNAAKFTQQGSIVLAYKVDEAADKLLFSVTDTGCGIPVDKRDIIFDRFVKLNKSAPGAGLGLTISKLLAKMLGGDVWLDSSYKRGARFYFSIPLGD